MSTPILPASASCVSFMGFSHSSKRISPGVVGARFVGSLIVSSSVIVGDHDVAGVTSLEVEDDAELIVDANAELARQSALELFQMIAGTRQIPQFLRVVQC